MCDILDLDDDERYKVHPRTDYEGLEGARWRWVVNATPGHFTPGEQTRYPLCRGLGVPQG